MVRQQSIAYSFTYLNCQAPAHQAFEPERSRTHDKNICHVFPDDRTRYHNHLPWEMWGESIYQMYLLPLLHVQLLWIRLVWYRFFIIVDCSNINLASTHRFILIERSIFNGNSWSSSKKLRHPVTVGLLVVKWKRISKGSMYKPRQYERSCAR